MQLDVALEPDQLRLVQQILRAHVPHREVRVFGSRVTGAHKPTSDLDLCIMGDDRLSPTLLEHLRFAFGESFLPMRVDVTEWATLTDSFRSIIDAASTTIQSPQ